MRSAATAVRRAGLRVEPLRPRSRRQHDRTEELRVSATDVLLKERAALCDTLARVRRRTLPTLCEGWLTADLAAHCSHARSGPTRRLGHRAPRTVREAHAAGDGPVQGQGLRRDGRRSCGTARRSTSASARWPPLNVVENWIHHEDVRRGERRGPAPARSRDRRDPLGLAEDAHVHGAPQAQEGRARCCKTPDGRERVVKTGGSARDDHGAPGELVLFMSGRKEAADVHLDGPPEAVAIVLATKLGI